MAESSFEPKTGNVKSAPSLSSDKRSTGTQEPNLSGSASGTTSGISGIQGGSSAGISGVSGAGIAGSSTGNTGFASSGSTGTGSSGASSTGFTSGTTNLGPGGSSSPGFSSGSTGTSSSPDFRGSQDSDRRFARGSELFNRLTDRVDDFARERLDQGGIGSKAADYVYGFTDLVDSASRSVRERDVEPFRSELSTKVRNNPVKAVALSVGLGFLIGKLIK